MFGNLNLTDAYVVTFAVIILVIAFAAVLSDKWAKMLMEDETKKEFDNHVRSAIRVTRTRN